jgi:hypothetical protein
MQNNYYKESSYDSRVSNPQESKHKKHKKQDSCVFTMYLITHIIISFFAIYLSWKCNPEFNPLAFAIALFCPYLYIIYALATSGGCGVFESMTTSLKNIAPMALPKV